MDETDFDVRTSLDVRFAADAACRDALDDGAGAELHEGVVPVDNLREIYRRRVEHLQRQGVETIGADDVLDRLSQAQGALRIASVDSEETHFVVFVDPETLRVVSCWGVPSRHADEAQSPL